MRHKINQSNAGELLKMKMENQIENQMTKQQIANEWTRFAKASFYYDDYDTPEECEFNQYAPISDAQWNNFGYYMSFITESWEDPTPSGSAERTWYRAYATMITEGREGTKKLIGEIIDGTAHPYSIAYQMIDLITFSDRIFNVEA